VNIFPYICCVKFFYFDKGGWMPPEESGFFMSIPLINNITVMPCAPAVMAGAAFIDKT
jgi:hypothetical protein